LPILAWSALAAELVVKLKVPFLERIIGFTLYFCEEILLDLPDAMPDPVLLLPLRLTAFLDLLLVILLLLPDEL
jgi:hypothetical protein